MTPEERFFINHHDAAEAMVTLTETLNDLLEEGFRLVSGPNGPYLSYGDLKLEIHRYEGSYYYEVDTFR